MMGGGWELRDRNQSKWALGGGSGSSRPERLSEWSVEWIPYMVHPG